MSPTTVDMPRALPVRHDFTDDEPVSVRPQQDSFKIVRTLHRKVIRNIIPSVQRRSESLHTKIIEVRASLQNTPVLALEDLASLRQNLEQKTQELSKFTDTLEKYQAYKLEGHGWLRRSWNRNHDPERFGLTSADADVWVKGSLGTHTSYLSDRIRELKLSTQEITQKLKGDSDKRQDIQKHLAVLEELEKNILGEELRPLSGESQERIAQITQRLGRLGVKIAVLSYECAPKIYGDELFGLLNNIRNNLEKAQQELNLIQALLRITEPELEKLDPSDFEFEPKYAGLLETLTPAHDEASLLIAEKIRLSNQLDQKKLKYQEIQTLREKIRQVEYAEIHQLDQIKDYKAVSNRPEILKILEEYRFKIEELFKRPPANTDEELDKLRLTYFGDFELQVAAAKQELDLETGRTLGHRIYLDPNKSLTESQLAQIDSGSDIFLDAMADTLEADLGKDPNFRTEDLLKKIGAEQNQNGNFTCTVCVYDKGIKYYPGTSFSINAHQAEVLRDFLEARTKDLIGGSRLFLEAKKDLEQLIELWSG